MTGLTTHVLDTALGRPASGLRIQLMRMNGEEAELIKTVFTNADGRVDGGPILAGEDFRIGQYELLFHAGDYLLTQGAELTDPPFLDVIPIRFGIADPQAHYHVPLLLSPYGYSTYRGS
ncbi:hydroxyisourate hydrolase [Agrobacterium vitis]|uniref:5-hydroxyisourate hydrolase n=1 Tax=Agrobacterium vitis TaxID=373 RepID=A0AAE4X2V8_AGRVI|nr:hydroxyisourate hydrolase [Agrobacterium vitis]MBF2715260.1 hydroxyisourate hydrolase [Agrobacterium vitis]MUO80184.1 hydroxyisourate hydrolase [Agrobacterium vitis]MUO97303.1 hydroxyisourate hydrolase [Agrobacterium vitis]MUP03698.1 hydroxyisourate hydrolase [Agrobacterium vitis]MUZ65144.1 hydroxyisourate hydrolase [Agrobacterium vitis]